MKKMKSLVLLLVICIFLIGLTEAGKTSGYKCAPSLTNCFGNCVDLKSDFNNCGTCGMECPPGFVCDKKRCVCPTGLTECNGKCVDLQSDPDNCAACGLTCTGGNVCSGGVCACPEGTVKCSGMCLDVTSDVSNCGACGVVCPSGVCTDGMCYTTPPVVLSVDEWGGCPDLEVNAHVTGDVGVVSVKCNDIDMSLIEGNDKDGIWHCVTYMEPGECLELITTATDAAGNIGTRSDVVCSICVIPVCNGEPLEPGYYCCGGSPMPITMGCDP